jgi:hypothetical protein
MEVAMERSINKDDKYMKILDTICLIKGISREQLIQILKDRESKYLLFLLLKKYNCTDLEILNRDFSIESKKSISYNMKKAEEKFFINKEFRDMYFEAEGIVGKAIK